MVDKAQDRPAEAYDKAQKLGSDAIDQEEDAANRTQDGLGGLLGEAEIAEPTNASDEEEKATDEDSGLLDKLRDRVLDVIGKDNT